MRLSNGRIASTDEGIISLLTFNLDRKIWECLGTGFFINPMGGFITAKHVVMNFQGRHVPTLYGVHTTENSEHHLRVANNFSCHPTADIAIGMLGERVDQKKRMAPEMAIPFQMNFNQLNINDKVSSYAFPQVETEQLNDDELEFTFQGKWSQGEVLEFCPDGRGLTQNRCYMTNMDIRGGASGGPVIHNNRVIGINSSGMDGVYSLITPVDFILDLSVYRQNAPAFPVRKLIEDGHIFVDRYCK